MTRDYPSRGVGMTEQTEGAEVEALEYLVDMARGHDYVEIAKLSEAEDTVRNALAAAEVRGARAVLAAVEAEASSRSAGRLDVLRAARAAAAAAGGGGEAESTRSARLPRRQYDPDHCTACGDFQPCGNSWITDESHTEAAERLNQSAANRGRGY